MTERFMASRRGRAGALVVLVVLLVQLGGCTRFLANFLDDFAVIKIKSYIPLDQSQETFIRQVIGREMSWLKEEGYRQVIAILQEAKDRTLDGLNEEDFRWGQEIFEGQRRLLTERLLPDTSRLLATLDQRQIKVMSQRMAEDREELEERLRLPAQERFEQRLKVVRKFAETWVGPLSPDQRKKLEGLLRQVPDVLPERLRFVKRLQHDLVALLSKEKDPGRLREGLRALVVRDQGPGPYSKARDRELAGYKTLVFEMDRCLTPAQRERLGREVESKIQLIRDLGR